MNLTTLPKNRSKDAIRRALAEMSPLEIQQLAYDWTLFARPGQLPPPGDWTYWLALAGRGWGKTRTGAEFVRWARRNGARRIALVAPTKADARETMVLGESGIMAVHPPDDRPIYAASHGKLIWKDGSRAWLYSAEEPDRLRGPNFDAAWCDELAAWKNVQDTWDMLSFGLRKGKPRCLISTTPRPIKLLTDLMANEAAVISRGTTKENRRNLAPSFFSQIVKRYEGTRIGRQELDGEILMDTEGALWTSAMIDATRCGITRPDLRRVVVAIDPAVTSGADADETGIIVAGVGVDGLVYVLADLSCRLPPDGWANRAVNAFDSFGADRIIAEVNNGGDLVERVIRTVRPQIAYSAVRASRGKVLRAEPVAALYEQKRVKHTVPFNALELQMMEFTSDYDKSPDRLDALVWAITALVIDAEPELRIRSL
jgi:phage terminase large subunit-like protein